MISYRLVYTLRSFRFLAGKKTFYFIRRFAARHSITSPWISYEKSGFLFIRQSLTCSCSVLFQCFKLDWHHERTSTLNFKSITVVYPLSQQPESYEHTLARTINSRVIGEQIQRHRPHTHAQNQIEPSIEKSTVQLSVVRVFKFRTILCWLFSDLVENLHWFMCGNFQIFFTQISYNKAVCLSMLREKTCSHRFHN